GQDPTASAVENRADAHRNRPARNVGFTAKGPGVLFQGQRSERLHTRARAEGGERRVEPDMTSLPDAEELEVNAAKPGHSGFVTPALGVEGGRRAIRQVRIA